MKPGATPKPESRNGYQVEIDTLRREFARVSLQLQQQETFISHLKDAEIQKDDTIVQLESELSTLKQLHVQEISVIAEENQTKQLEAQHKIRFLELEVARLQEESKLDNHFEEENKALRQTLLEQQQQVELLQRRVVDLQGRTIDDSGETRQQLEEEFKRRLTEAESKYQTEAYRALSEEAKLALQGNDHLQTILSKQNDSIQNVLNRCKLLESSHSKLKTEQELSLQSLRLHQAEVQKLRKQLTDSKSRCQQLEEDLNQRRIERASLELLFIEYEKSQREMQRLQDRLRRAQRQAERWRNRVILLQQELGSESRYNSKQNLSTEGAMRRAAARQVESRADSSDDDGEYDALSGEGMPVQVDPREILAMWNVNFEQWKPAGHDELRSSTKRLETSTQAPLSTLEPPQKARPTADQVRLEKDRDLSVLSKGRATGGKRTKAKAAAEAQQFSVAEGQIQFAVRPSGYKGPPNTRFLVP